MRSSNRNRTGAYSGAAIGTLGGLIGLGGAEFRLPLLVGVFKLATLEALILNKAMSLVVVTMALVFRGVTISFSQLLVHWPVALNLLTGSLTGAWWAAGYAIGMPRHVLDRVVMALLIVLSAVLMWEAAVGMPGGASPLFESPLVLWMVGLVAGVCIGAIAALLGVAGGELLIPTIVLLYGADIKLAGSLSLMVSLPTMLVGFARYARADAFAVLKQEQSLMRWMVVGSVFGAAMGGLLLGMVPVRPLMGLLGVVLLLSALMTFRHSQTLKTE